MRNRKWVLLAAIGLLAALIGQGIYADYKSGNENVSSAEPIRQSLPAPTPAAGSNNFGANPSYSPDLADGEGKDEVAYNCALCHSLSYITMRPPISAQNWAHEVNMMRGFYGASMSDSTAQKIIEYLGSHYTPETLKR